jgi:hypothetical protein
MTQQVSPDPAATDCEPEIELAIGHLDRRVTALECRTTRYAGVLRTLAEGDRAVYTKVTNWQVRAVLDVLTAVAIGERDSVLDMTPEEIVDIAEEIVRRVNGVSVTAP